MAPALARGAGRRAVLASRVAAARLRAHRVPDDDRRRVGRRLPNNTLRTFEAMSCPKRLLVGPWSHMSTATSLPGPHIDLVPELIRWFARWLARRAERHRRGTADRGLHAPFDAAGSRISRRCAASGAPSRPGPRSACARASGGPRAPTTDRISVRGDVGTAAWISCAGKAPWGLPDDQREDDARSLTYDWPALDGELELLGHPRLQLTVASPDPGRVPVGAAVRRLPGRHVGAREPRCAQPRAS